LKPLFNRMKARVPPILGRHAKRLSRAFNPRRALSKDPFDGVSWRAERAIWRLLRRSPSALMEVATIRAIIARERAAAALAMRQVARLANDPSHAARNTLGYNLDALRTSADLDRPMSLIRPILSIPRVERGRAALRVLSIGPRSEIEIFALMASGFRLENITAIDLFSYSPYIKVGDMHALPFGDNLFDIVLLGWVLSYSKEHATVAREVQRVARDDAIIAIAADYSDSATVSAVVTNESTHVQSCGQILDLFRGHVGQVYFRHEPDGRREPLVMTIFQLRRPR
jgi:hypothetical protein